MLIEAAKGGHTTVVSVLIDYNPGNLSGSEEGVTPGSLAGAASEAITEVVSDTELIPTRFPAEGHEQATSATQPAPPAVSSLPNKSKYVSKSFCNAEKLKTSMFSEHCDFPEFFRKIIF